jgi:hypothetical protein
MYVCLFASLPNVHVCLHLRYAYVCNTTGAGGFDDDEGPEKPNSWLVNSAFSLVAAKGVFLLFANGLLHVCERIQNPLDGKQVSFCRSMHGE